MESAAYPKPWDFSLEVRPPRTKRDWTDPPDPPLFVETRTRKLRVKFATGFEGSERLARVQKEIGKRLKLKPGDEDAFGSLSVDYQEGELNDKLGISLSRNEEELLFETSIDGPAGRLVASNQKNPYLKYLDWLIRAKLAHPEIDDDSLFKIFSLAESKK